MDNVAKTGFVIDEWNKLPTKYRRGVPNKRFYEFASYVNEIEDMMKTEDSILRPKTSIEYDDRSGEVQFVNYTHQLYGDKLRKFCDIVSKFDMIYVDDSIEGIIVGLKMNSIFDDSEWVKKAKRTLAEK